jgi:4-hydroxy-tetrahydrodipicolinate synthase
MMFKGSIPALVTPFRDGAFDERAFRKLIDWQIASGSSALAPCGTTGENSTLTSIERERVIAVCIEQSEGRVPVIAGCGTNDTATTLSNIHKAEACGAKAALVVVPYYSRPSEAGLLAHFSHLARNSTLPIVLYNVPGRTITDLRPELVCELVNRFPDTYVGIKDATGELWRVTEHSLGVKASNRFFMLSGDDKTALGFNAAGGVGCISVTANVAPSLCAEFQAASEAGDQATALALHKILNPLHRAMFAENSPAPCKYALSQIIDGMTHELRLPLVPCSLEARRIVDAAMLQIRSWTSGYAD